LSPPPPLNPFQNIPHLKDKMSKRTLSSSPVISILLTAILLLSLQGCYQSNSDSNESGKEKTSTVAETPEFFSLRREVEKAFGYTHAVKIGNDLKISGAVSMDSAGAPTAVGDLAQQMKNCYADLDKVLKHYGYTFDDVIVENVFTTNMPEFLKQAGYRNTIYTKQFPTGSWLGVKELALPEFLIEIELEAHKSK
jgi:enamine deaminase RidA (YjgF/YER057c/UK114 family)